MNKKCHFVFIIALSMMCSSVFGDLQTDRAVIRAGSLDRIVATVKFKESLFGDLYVAMKVNNELIFITDEGTKLSTTPAPFRFNQLFEEDITVLDVANQNITPGRYPLFKVVTLSGADPLDFRNWIGGLGGLSRVNFIIGLSTEESFDFDNDGFPDDDLNRDGFHDETGPGREIRDNIQRRSDRRARVNGGQDVEAAEGGLVETAGDDQVMGAEDGIVETAGRIRTRSPRRIFP